MGDSAGTFGVADTAHPDGANSFYRVLVDPRDGAPLEIGRKSYRLPETVKRWLRMRDGKCTFPGCNNHTLNNETDHLQAWQPACPGADFPFLEPPPQEPLSEDFLDLDDIPADDAFWEDFYAAPIVVPHDPVKDWERALI